jgi:hypothetical protein
MGNQSWVYFNRRKACGNGKFSIVANLVTKSFWSPSLQLPSPIMWQLKKIQSPHNWRLNVLGCQDDW